MFKKALRLALFVCACGTVLSSSGSVLAQNRPVDTLPADVKSSINQSLSNALNAIHVFSATDTVSSGHYTFDPADGERAKLDVMRIGAEYRFCVADSAEFVPFISGTVGKVKLTDRLAPPEAFVGTDDFTTIVTYSAGVGGGVDAKLWNSLHLIPKFHFVYSHTSNDYDYNNQFSQSVIAPFDGDAFNWDVDAFSYVPSVRLLYAWETPELKITPSVNYSYLYVNSFWTNSALLDVKTKSNLLQSKLEVEKDLGITLAEMPLTGHLFGTRYDIYGDASAGLGFKAYHEVGFGFTVASAGIVPVFSKLGLIASYSWNSDFDGYRIGLEGEL